jgi:hypothetical protein
MSVNKITISEENKIQKITIFIFTKINKENNPGIKIAKKIQ